MDQYYGQLSGLTALYLPKVLFALLTLVVGFWLAGMVSRIAGNLLHKNKVEVTIIPFLTSIVSVLLKVMVLISAASRWRSVLSLMAATSLSNALVVSNFTTVL